MDEQRQDDQQEYTYNSSVLIRDVTLRACRKQWTIEKGVRRWSGISVLIVRHNDDDDDGIFASLFMSLYIEHHHKLLVQLKI